MLCLPNFQDKEEFAKLPVIAPGNVAVRWFYFRGWPVAFMVSTRDVKSQQEWLYEYGYE